MQVKIDCLSPWSWIAALTVLLGALPASPAIAQEPSRLSVGASGFAARVPDRAWIRFTASTEAKTPAEAIEANAVAIKGLLDQLRAKGIAAKNLQTAALTLQAKYEVKRDGAREIRGDLLGYIASKSVTAVIEDVALVPSYIREFPLAGILRIADVGFYSTETEAAQSEALVNAIQRAHQAARTAVAAAGRKLGPVSSIEVSILGGQSGPPRSDETRYPWQQSDAALGPRLVAEPGEQQFNQPVTMQWQLR